MTRSAKRTASIAESDAWGRLAPRRSLSAPPTYRQVRDEHSPSRIRNAVDLGDCFLWRVTTADTPWVQRHLFTDPDVVRWWEEGIPQSDQQTQSRMENWCSRWDNHKPSWWIVRKKESHIAMGAIGFRSCAPKPEMEVAFIFAQRHWNQGWATGVLAGACRHMDQVWDFTKVYATVHPENRWSIKTLRHNGFKLEGNVGMYSDARHVFVRPRSTESQISPRESRARFFRGS